MNVVEFALKMKEGMSAVLQKVAQNAHAAFVDVDKSIAGTQSKMAGLAKNTQANMNKASVSIAGLQKRIDALKQTRDLKVNTSDITRANREVYALEQHLKKLKNIGMPTPSPANNEDGGGKSMWQMARGSFVGNLAARGVEMAARKTIEIGESALGAGADAEQQIIGLGTFIGKDKAKGLYDELQKDSAHTPYTTSTILPGMLQLIASGQTVEKSKKDLWALMNAESATGNAGNAFALELGEGHLAQMASTGKADAYFMKEFQRTLHIPMQRLLAEEMFPKNVKGGMKKIAEWTENGELKDHVTYDMFIGAMDKASKAGGMFANSLEDQSKTIKGKWSTILDWWNIGMAKLVLNPTTHDNITALEDRIIGGLENIPSLIAKISPWINSAFDWVNDIWPNVKNLALTALEALKPIGSLLFSKNIKDLVTGAASFSASILKSLIPVMEVLAVTLEKLSPVLTGILNILNGPFVNVDRKVKLAQDLRAKNAPPVLPGISPYESKWPDLAKFLGMDIKKDVKIPYLPGFDPSMNIAGIDDKLSDTADSITGAGRKITNIHFHAPIFKDFKYDVKGGMFETLADIRRKFEEWFLEMLNSVNAAQG